MFDDSAVVDCTSGALLSDYLPAGTARQIGSSPKTWHAHWASALPKIVNAHAKIGIAKAFVDPPLGVSCQADIHRAQPSPYLQKTQQAVALHYEQKLYAIAD